jgi:ectoine hydroxylase-related dioxygenase (phytanoyl-CoA dioxygenase family)
MMTPVSPEHDWEHARDAFRRDGYLYVRDLLSAECKAEWIRLVTELSGAKRGTTTNVQTGKDMANTTGKQTVVIPNFVQTYTERIMRVTTDPPVRRLLERLLGDYSTNPNHVYFRIRTHREYTPVHADWKFFSDETPQPNVFDATTEWSLLHRPLATKPLPYLTIWLPLTSCNPTSGGLLLAAGSHSRYTPIEGEQVPRDFDPATADWTGANFEIGDAVLFEARTVHAGASNQQTKFKRMSVDFRVMGGSAPLDPRGTMSPLTPLGDVVSP